MLDEGGMYLLDEDGMDLLDEGGMDLLDEGRMDLLDEGRMDLLDGIKPFRNPTYGSATYSNMAYFPREHFFIFLKN